MTVSGIKDHLDDRFTGMQQTENEKCCFEKIVSQIRSGYILDIVPVIHITIHAKNIKEKP